jgi:hypothetical protein
MRLAGCAERADAVERRAEPVFLGLQVIADLQVQPEPLGGAEVPGQPKRRVCGDATLAVDDLIDPPAGTSIALASWYWLTPSGWRNSCSRISPGCTGGMTVFSATGSSLVIINDLPIFRPGVGPGDVTLL